MPAPPNNDDPFCHETASQKLSEALQRDTEGQRELIGARARGETDAVYWKDNQRPLELPASPDLCSAD